MRRTLGICGVVLVAVTLTLSGCGQESRESTTPTVPSANMPNPASVHCEEQGGRVEIRTAEDGSQYGVCVFVDGSECEEWAFYRGECKPGGADEQEGEVSEVPEGATKARDAALAHLRQKQEADAPAEGIAWSARRTTPEDLLGSETYEFSGEGWTVTVFYMVVAPEHLSYDVTVDNEGAAFHWEGKVDPQGQVTDSAGSAS